MISQESFFEDSVKDQKARPTSEELDVWEAAYKVALTMGIPSPLTNEQTQLLFSSGRLDRDFSSGMEKNSQGGERERAVERAALVSMEKGMLVLPSPINLWRL